MIGDALATRQTVWRQSWRRARQERVELDRDTLLGMYERMMQIRTFEDLAGKNFADGLVPGFVHLYAGEEAVAVGICSHLTDNDYIT